ncbi:LysR family transcriptional regulator [Dokdonia sinensis]|uniref:LysR family transcriptional regulator n=1 Tax=Dokdonia sinensis TaxID=2479847 RepID=A0A3M0GG68_9FLAO|nr:LysR family transcriptional regulator [Dokdonia sinensis]RMB63288.1 LysR family transcriptional regulator [Dokdonia sinensis]
MHYTLHQLQVFIKIADLRSITKAAEELCLTQPAVSIQLKNFQNQFPIPLTEVVGRQLYVTEFGKEIAEAARNILEEVKTINHKTLAYQGELSGTLNIAIVSTAKYVIPYFLTDFMRQNTGVDLQMDVTNKSSVITSLENNEIDFAMVSTIPPNLKLDSIPLMKNKLYFVGPREHKLSGRNITRKQFKSLPLIFREQGSATRNAMENYLNKIEIPATKKIALTSNEAVKQAVISGLGYSILPLIGLKNELFSGDLHIIPAKDLPVVTEWNLVWLKAKKLSPVATALRDYLEASKDQIIKDKFEWFEAY